MTEEVNKVLRDAIDKIRSISRGKTAGHIETIAYEAQEAADKANGAPVRIEDIDMSKHRRRSQREEDISWMLDVESWLPDEYPGLNMSSENLYFDLRRALRKLKYYVARKTGLTEWEREAIDEIQAFNNPRSIEGMPRSILESKLKSKARDVDFLVQLIREKNAN